MRTLQPTIYPFLYIFLYAFLFFIFASTTQAQELKYQDQQQLHDIQRQVSAERIEKDIRKLVSFGTRHTLSETQSETSGIGEARRGIKSEFENISKTCDVC